MPYIAELQIKVDSSQVESATKNVKEFTQATSGAVQAEQKVRKARDDTAKATDAAAKATEKAEAKAAKAEQQRLDQWFQLAARRDKEETSLQQRRDSIMAKNINGMITAANKQAQLDAAASAAEEKRYNQTLKLYAEQAAAEQKRLNAIATARDKAAKAEVIAAQKAANEVTAAQTKAQNDALKEQQAIDKIRYQATLRRYADEAKLATQSAKPSASAPSGGSSTDAQEKSLRNLLAAIDPVTASMQRLDKQQQALNSNKGVLTTEQFTKYQNVIDSTRAKVLKYNDTMGKTSLTAKQLQFAQQGLPAQFSDIAVSLQGGQAPFTVFLQQGAQIKDMFGGWKPAVRGVASAVGALITPLSAAGIALAAVAYLAYQGSNELSDFNKAVVTSGQFSGTSASQFTAYRTQISGVAGTAAEAAEALVAMQSSGKITGDLFERVGEIAVKMQRTTGQSIQDTVDDFASLGKDPVSAVVTLDDKYKFLTASVLQQIDALQRNGDVQGAVTLAQTTLADATDKAADRMIEKLGYVARAWRATKDAVSDVGDAISNIGRENSNQDNLDKINKEIETRKQAITRLLSGAKLPQADLDARLASDETLKGYQAEADKLKYLIGIENWAADKRGENERARIASVAAQGRIDSGALSARTAVEKARDELKKAAQDWDATVKGAAVDNKRVTADQISTYAAYKTDLEGKLKDAIEADKKKNAGPKSATLDNNDINDLKNQVNEIKSQYKNLNEGVKAELVAGTITAEEAYNKRKNLITQETVATKAAYQEQIDGLEKLKGSKNISANQTIGLDRQISDARSKMVIAEQDAQKQLTAAATKETERVRTQKNNIDAYNESLSQMIDNLRKAGERERAGIGQSSGQRDLSSKMNAEDDRYADEVRTLNRSRAENPELAGQVEIELQAAAKAHTDMKNQIVGNYNQMLAAQKDWGAGAKSAFEQYIEDGQNYAGMTNSAFTSAFGNMEDALTSFVTTGKLSFADLTKSILADLAKMAIRIAASNALSAVLTAWGGSASTPSSASMGSATTYSDGIMAAKGAAFKPGGTQFFAKGGAFTNSVVSKPTAFSTAGSSKNVMGEAGPEAIMPLTRSSDGSLGVRAQVDLSGLQQQSGGGVQVNITIDGQGNTKSQSSDSGYSSFGTEVGQFVDQRYRQLISKDLQPGGDIWKTMNG